VEVPVFSVVVSALLFASNIHATSVTSIVVDVGYRSDDVNFNISGDINGNNPNILSELLWTNLRILQKKISVEHRGNKAVLIASISEGSISSGSNQDSDYLGDNRTLEFSRSYNNSSGDGVVDREIAFGYQFDFHDPRSKDIAYIVPMMGYSYHEQNLRMTNGNDVVQLFPNLILQPFPGLNSTYQTEWEGRWVGAKLWFKTVAGRDTLSLFFKHHWPDFSAEANWNLRPDFAHPKSFEHQARGFGNELLIEWVENTTQTMAFKMGLHFQKWRTDPGIDIVYFSDGTVAATRLNRVEWKSTAFSIGLEFRI
jgi:hypothetical protein